MNTFLREVRRLIRASENVCLIIGNESCDLDSAVCSLSLAYYYWQNKELIPSKRNKNLAAIPVLNIAKNEYPLRTEVVHCLQKYSIDEKLLTFKDELEETYIRNNDIILVDHHVSPYADSVIEVFDHRAFDESSKLPQHCKTQIELIGSCSTLIANLFLKLENPKQYEEPLKLLYSAILLDTVNFCKKADRARQLDVNVVENIERLLEMNKVSEHRQNLFDEFVRARADISHLTPYQLLLKDMKLISNPSKTKRVALPGFPVLVQDFIQMKEAEQSLKYFIEENKCNIVVLLGMKVTDGVVERDLGFVNGGDDELFNLILKNVESTEANLDLLCHEECVFLNGTFFNQKNIRASRKQILPIVKNVLNTL